jgi:hypothetical protein
MEYNTSQMSADTSTGTKEQRTNRCDVDETSEEGKGTNPGCNHPFSPFGKLIVENRDDTS